SPSLFFLLSLHDALPICWLRSTQDSSKEASRFVDRPDRLRSGLASHLYFGRGRRRRIWVGISPIDGSNGSVELFLGGTSLRNFRSEEHTSELQSLAYLVC